MSFSGTTSHQTGAAAEITRGLAHLHTEYYGKGPTKARTHLVDDTVICLLEGGFTTVERTLIAAGNAEVVHNMRRGFQSAMEERFTQIVEATTDRQVIAYMSQIHHNPDLAVELFFLEPSQNSMDGEHQGEIGGDR